MRDLTESLSFKNGSNTSTLTDREEGLQVEQMAETLKNRLTQTERGWHAEEVFATAIVCIIVPWIIIGNFLVIASVARFKKLQVPTNYFLVTLAVADIMTAVMVPFILTSELLAHRITNVYVCLVPQCAILTFCGVSVLCLVAIAYDRFTALANPLKYVNMVTIKKIVIFVSVSWLYAIALTWGPIMSWHNRKLRYQNTCSVGVVRRQAWILLLCLLFAPAFVVIFLCYSKIYIIARRHARAIAAVEISVHRTVEMHYFVKDTKYAKTLAIVIGFYLLSWIPFQLCLLIEASTNMYIAPWCRNFLALLAYSNSGVNPWVYAYKNSDFRTAFKKVLRETFSRCKLRTQRRTSATSEFASELPASSAALRLCRTESHPNPADLIHIMYSPEFAEYNEMMGRKQRIREAQMKQLRKITTASTAKTQTTSPKTSLAKTSNDESSNIVNNTVNNKRKLHATNSNDSGFIDASNTIQVE